MKGVSGVRPEQTRPRGYQAPKFPFFLHPYSSWQVTPFLAAYRWEVQSPPWPSLFFKFLRLSLLRVDVCLKKKGVTFKAGRPGALILPSGDLDG
jgi:hypothetical protein